MINVIMLLYNVKCKEKTAALSVRSAKALAGSVRAVRDARRSPSRVPCLQNPLTCGVFGSARPVSSSSYAT